MPALWQKYGAAVIRWAVGGIGWLLVSNGFITKDAAGSLATGLDYVGIAAMVGPLVWSLIEKHSTRQTMEKVVQVSAGAVARSREAAPLDPLAFAAEVLAWSHSLHEPRDPKDQRIVEVAERFLEHRRQPTMVGSGDSRAQ